LVTYILLYFALRKNELFEIGHKQKLLKIDYASMKATFRVEKRKGYVTKTLDFDEQTRKILEEYQKEPPLTDTSGMNHRLQRYDKKMGYRVYPHLMRHVAISHMRRVVAPLYPNWDFLIKHISGHKQNKDMTNLYTDAAIFEQELKECQTVNHWIRQVKITW